MTYISLLTYFLDYHKMDTHKINVIVSNMTTIYKNIGNNIKRLRMDKNLSQGDLAKRMKVDRSYVSSLESGSRNPSVKILDKISRILHVEITQLISGGSGNMLDFMSEFKLFHDGDPWMLGEDIPDMDFFFVQIFLRCTVNEFKYTAGQEYKKILCVHKGYHLWFYFGEKDSFSVGENIVKKFLKDHNFIIRVNREIEKESDALRKLALKLPETNLSLLSNQELYNYYENHFRVHTRFYQWCWIPAATDMFHNNFTNVLKQYLKKKGVSDSKINEYFTILTQPATSSLIQEEREEFLTIALQIQKDSYHQKLFKDLYELFEEKEAAPFGLATHTPEYEKLLEQKMDLIRDKIKHTIYKRIEAHYHKYFYVKYMWIGNEGVNNFDYYLKELVKIIGRDSNVKKLLQEQRQKSKEVLRQKRSLVKKLSINNKWKIIFNGFGDFMVTKIYRRYAQIYVLYRMRPVLEEIARRLNITLMEVRFMLGSEIKQGLMKNKVDRVSLKERTKFCVYYGENKKEKIFIGENARQLANMVEVEEVKEVQEFTGQTGCVGRASGIVKIVIRPADMVKMNKGDVLVSIATNPDIVPAMKKAAAIVTEQGGVTSHAAIVSRELNTPCIIGTKIATRVLKDGDLVEVDANKGVVKILKKGE